jgi:hypothetical protein
VTHNDSNFAQRPRPRESCISESQTRPTDKGPLESLVSPFSPQLKRPTTWSPNLALLHPRKHLQSTAKSIYLRNLAAHLVAHSSLFVRRRRQTRLESGVQVPGELPSCLPAPPAALWLPRCHTPSIPAFRPDYGRRMVPPLYPYPFAAVDKAAVIGSSGKA